LVDETKLRFDFSWNGPLGLKELKDVEEIVQGRINDAVPVEAFVAPLEAAQKISSLRAVFGEKYPDPVRVVSVAPFKIPDMLENPQDSAWKEYSVEFCGGTHLTNTKEAEAFVLLSEEGIAKGIRRITGVTMADATKAILDGKTIEDKVKAAGSLDGDELEEEVKKLTPELNELSISAALKIELRETLVSYSKKVVAYKKEKVAAMTGVIVEQALAKAASTEGEKVVLRYDFGIDGKIAKAVTQAFGKQCKDKALMLITGDTETDRIMIVAATPKGVAVDCKAWVDATTEGTDGKGGGNKDSAQSTLTGMASMDSVVAKALQ
jgi:alanyl-tRNA synthetase